jgi:hypothetical protein
MSETPLGFHPAGVSSSTTTGALQGSGDLPPEVEEP